MHILPNFLHLQKTHLAVHKAERSFYFSNSKKTKLPVQYAKKHITFQVKWEKEGFHLVLVWASQAKHYFKNDGIIAGLRLCFYSVYEKL